LVLLDAWSITGSVAAPSAFWNQGPFPPPALPGFVGTTNPSATHSRPNVCTSGGRAENGHLERASRVSRHSLLTCCRPPPRRSRTNSSSKSARSMPAFPQSRQGRPSHRVFRGRLGVHTCYGLPTCSRPEAGFCLPSFDCFVTSTTVGIATRPGRPLPGQDFHLLEQRNFHGTPGPQTSSRRATTSLPSARTVSSQ
jgi:hypothetical protein